MAEQIVTGNVTHSVPSLPVVKCVQIKLFLGQTPISSTEKDTKTWVRGAPTPIHEGQMSPNMEALNFLAGFASGNITMEGDKLKHIPMISQSLETIWDTPRKKNVNGSAHHTKKATIAKKKPQKHISNQLATQNPHIRVPDSEIRIENIIQDSPQFVPYKIKTPVRKGKGKGVKNIQLIDDGSASGMAHTKKTLTAKQKSAKAAKAAQATKSAIQKLCQTTSTGKAPRTQLAIKVPRKQGGKKGLKPKPHQNYALIALREIQHFQKSVDLLIPLLPFQRLIHEITQEFNMNLHFQSSAILALQEAAEAWLVSLFESANLCCIHQGHITISPNNFELVKRIHHIAGINMWWH